MYGGDGFCVNDGQFRGACVKEREENRSISQFVQVRQ